MDSDCGSLWSCRSLRPAQLCVLLYLGPADVLLIDERCRNEVLHIRDMND
jgi:hypothetical protein